MPVENERKYILDVEDPEAFKASLLLQPVATAYSAVMEQAYLTTNARIRKVKQNDVAFPRHFFTYKQMVDGDLIEIETRIEHSDFKALWSVATGKIRKTRITIEHGGYFWEVDFFYDEDKDIYLVMVEVELPARVKEPKLIPSFVADNLLYAVPVDDERFFNSKLSDVDMVRELVKGLKA